MRGTSSLFDQALGYDGVDGAKAGMIVCPNCNHQNPDGAVQCEACYTPLPMMMSCPSCGSTVQADASFCGQCGFNLRSAPATKEASSDPPPTLSPDFEIPELVPPEPLLEPEPLVSGVQNPPAYSEPAGVEEPPPPVPPDPLIPPPPAPIQPAVGSEASSSPSAASPPDPYSATPSPDQSKTQLQLQSARLLHLQTNTFVELPPTLSVIHIGKPNERVPPDVDVSGFPNSEIVSRIHADLRIEGGVYFIEDVGSSNGTYINNTPLPVGNRHRLRPGDRIALGKGDKVTFLFQLP